VTGGFSLTDGPLAGLRVLNLSSTLGGAFVGQFYADFGAEVVMVEPPGGSPLRAQAGWPIWGRGSKSLEATLDDPAVRALAFGSDVLIDTFRPGVTDRHGLGYEDLVADNPRLVYVSITAFGTDGPLSHIKGYEAVVMAKIGAYSQFSALVDRSGPAFATVNYCTVSAAELAIIGSLVALYEREHSGSGQKVDTTLVQGIAAHDTWNWMISFWARKYAEAFTQVPVVNTQRAVPNSWLSYGLLQGLSADGRWLQFSQATPKLFQAFLTSVGLDDPEWNDAWSSEDLDRREAFWDRLLNAVRARTVAEWQETFDAHPQVFAEIFRSGTELLSHPQMLHDDQVATVHHPELGEVRQPRPLVRLSKTPGRAEGPLPTVGEHDDDLRQRSTDEGGGRDGAAHTVASEEAAGLPLDGVTVVELGTFYAAPFGATVLADLGARVIKIEQLDGDPIRFQLPFPEIGGVKVTQGKQSVAVDFNTPEGHDIVMRLLTEADLVLQSYRAGVATRLGLDEASVRAINPDVIYHEAPGFGTAGPYGHRPAYAPTIGAGAGMARRNVGPAVPERDDLTLDEVKDGAIRMGAACLTVGHADGFSSLAVGCGLALGLLARQRGAGGQGVLTTMLSTLAHVLSDDMVEYEGRPLAPTADSGLYGLGPLYRLYEAGEGWVFLAAPSAREWSALVDALPAGSGLDDPMFATADGRASHADELAQRLAAVFGQRSAAKWELELGAVDVACVEVVMGASHDVLLAPGGLAFELGMTTEVEHPLFGPHARLTALVSYSRSATRAEAGISIGQHTDAVLRELGFDDAQLSDLAERNVIGRP
jgi:crotonobetainyl-CoA:carnitine CoA-transferase CaiB-like acyl-CoA transferase